MHCRGISEPAAAAQASADAQGQGPDQGARQADAPLPKYLFRPQPDTNDPALLAVHEALADIEDAAEEAAAEPGATAASVLSAAVPYHAEAFGWEEGHYNEHATIIWPTEKMLQEQLLERHYAERERRRPRGAVILISPEYMEQLRGVEERENRERRELVSKLLQIRKETREEQLKHT